MRNHVDREDVRESVLRSATEYVETVGLSLGLTSSMVEKFANDAGVSHKQFSQVWPTPEAFLTDLFCELANQARIDRADSGTLINTWQHLTTRSGDLGTAEGRRKVLVDAIREIVQYNFDVVTASPKWRTYAALSTTIGSWPESEERARVVAALRASELAFIETMDSFYRNVLPTFGMRLKPEFRNDFEPFVVATASVIEGLGIVRSTVPAITGASFERSDASGSEAWSVAAIAYMAVFDAFIELDPNFVPETAVSRLSGGVDVSPEG